MEKFVVTLVYKGDEKKVPVVIERTAEQTRITAFIDGAAVLFEENLSHERLQPVYTSSFNDQELLFQVGEAICRHHQYH